MKRLLAYSVFIGVAVLAPVAKAETSQAPTARHHHHHSTKRVAKSRPPVNHAGAGEIGRASWYGARHQGKRTAGGKAFDRNAMVAAHRTLPLNSTARITNLANGKSVDVTVVDRGPVSHDRVIDVSEQAARMLDMKRAGIARVRVEPLIDGKPKRTQTAVGE